jgi:hypothetical protein
MGESLAQRRVRVDLKLCCTNVRPFRWTDPESGEPRTQAGMQSYRIEEGKLAETWISLLAVGSKWPDPSAQETWTSPPPMPT